MIARIIFVLGAALHWTMAPAAGTKFAVPEGAFEVRRVVLRPDRTEQDLYSVKAAFPATAVLEHYRRVLAPYVECERRLVWQGISDDSVRPPRFIHQFIRHWASRDNRELVTVGLRYFSAGAEWKDRPDNDVLQVTLLYERVGDATRAAREQGSSCDGSPVPAPRDRQYSPGPFITR